MSKINLYTKNGGISSTERTRLQRGMSDFLIKNGQGVIETTEKVKTLVIELGENEKGEMVLGTFDLGITVVHPDNKPKTVRKDTAKPTVEVEVFTIGD